MENSHALHRDFILAIHEFCGSEIWRGWDGRFEVCSVFLSYLSLNVAQVFETTDCGTCPGTTAIS